LIRTDIERCHAPSTPTAQTLKNSSVGRRWRSQCRNPDNDSRNRPSRYAAREVAIDFLEKLPLERIEIIAKHYEMIAVFWGAHLLRTKTSSHLDKGPSKCPLLTQGQMQQVMKGEPFRPADLYGSVTKVSNITTIGLRRMQRCLVLPPIEAQRREVHGS